MIQIQLVELTRLVENISECPESDTHIAVNAMCVASFNHTISETTQEEAGRLIVILIFICALRKLYGSN